MSKWPSHEPAVRSAKGKERLARLKADPVAHAAFKAKRAAYWKKHGDRHRSRQREKYRTNPKYRQLCKDRVAAYRVTPITLTRLQQKRKTQYWKNPELFRRKAKAWRLKNWDRWKKGNDARRYANRDRHNAYCRLKAILCTDGYCREQLSKYHPTKSCKEWTQDEVDAKRQHILLFRSTKVKAETVLLLRAEYRDDPTSTVWQLAQKHNVGFSNAHGIIANKFHYDPNYVPAKRIRNITKTQKTFALLAAAGEIAKALKGMNEYDKA